jgi:hemerythrin-like metal-binding protein
MTPTTTPWQREAEAAALSIDREHGLQLGLVDQLLASLEQNPNETPARFEDLLTTSDVHFASEEVLMRQHSYPKYGAHVEEHRRLVEALQDLLQRQARSEPMQEKVIALRRWLSAHIGGMDREFEAFVRAAQ